MLAGPIRRPKLSALKLDGRGRAMLGRLMRGVGARRRPAVGDRPPSSRARGFAWSAPTTCWPSCWRRRGRWGVWRRMGGRPPTSPSASRSWPRSGHWISAQAVVVQGGRVLGIEAAEGTDALIDRCAELRGDDEARPVLVKLPKPGQERRVDLAGGGRDDRGARRRRRLRRDRHPVRRGAGDGPRVAHRPGRRAGPVRGCDRAGSVGPPTAPRANPGLTPRSQQVPDGDGRKGRRRAATARAPPPDGRAAWGCRSPAAPRLAPRKPLARRVAVRAGARRAFVPVYPRCSRGR